MPKINITINNKSYNVRANASILQACEEVGIQVPRFCYHEKLSVAGNCRICLVEVDKSPKPVVSCAMPLSKGMIIYTETPLVKKARESVLEFLLINHPLDCPICDQGGECDLQDETLSYASDRSRYFEAKRGVEDKECGPIIKTIMTRCIHCTRCIRFSSEIAGHDLLGSFGRGEETEIGTYIQSFIKTELSGNLVDICPVGALTSKPYAFRTRSWELQKNETIDFVDGLCSDIVVQTRKTSAPTFNSENLFLDTKEDIVRILPRSNGLYVENWISDKTRYSFDGLKNQRLVSPIMIDKFMENRKVDWTVIFLELSYRLSRNIYQYWGHNIAKILPPARIAVIFESLADVESLYMISQTLKIFGGSDIQNGTYKTFLNTDVPNFYLFNREVNKLDGLSSLLLIFINTRFEASLLNTSLRKQQLSRDLFYATINNYSQLKFNNTHLGSNVNTVISLLENKTSITKKFANKEQSSIFFGAESLKTINGLWLQTMIAILSKNFYLKNKNEERLGCIHSNISSLSFANLGVSQGVRSILKNNLQKDKKINSLFVIQPHNFIAKKFISKSNYTHTITFATHKPTSFISDWLLPLKSLYERDGYLYNIEGRLRKFYKVVTAPVQAKSLDAFLLLLLRIQFTKANWLQTLSHMWSLDKESQLKTSQESFNKIFFENFYAICLNVKKNYLVVLTTPKNNVNFYSNDLISENSNTMAESMLFNIKNNKWNSFISPINNYVV